MLKPVQLDADHIHELKIKSARDEFARNPTRFNWIRLSGLVKQRSAEQVAKMEREKGLT